MEYTEEVCSLSGGKDSVAMLLKCNNKNSVFYDTGKEFTAIYNVMEKLKRIGFDIVTLKSSNTFDYQMFDRPVCKRGTKEIHKYGYGWCGGTCRWGTTEKLKLLDRHAKINNCKMAIGIAFDEKNRIEKERKDYKVMPLVDLKMTESDCLKFCYEKGIKWLEKTASKFDVPEYIDLYSILKRVSCWCCRNKNLKELKNYYIYFTYSYWEMLKELEQKIGVKMKGNKWLWEYEEKWEKEILAEKALKEGK